MRKFLFIALMLLVPMQLFAAVKADQITTNNPTKATVDFLKSIDVQTNDGMYLPSGTTAQRPAVPAKDGMLRYNQDSDQAEIYANGNWGSIGGGLAKWVTGKAYKVDDVIFNGTKIYKALLDHTSGVFATDLANGDWVELAQADLSNYVDRTTNQTVGGNKTLTGEFRVNNLARISGSLDVIQDTSLQGNVAVAGDLYVTGDTRLDLSMNGYVKAANGLLSAADLNLATDVTGILPIANGGTGASAKNFVDLTTNQSAAGDKTFTGQTTFSNRVTMTDMINIDRPAGIVKTDSSGNIEVGTVNLPTEVVGSLPQNNGGNGNLIPTNASFELSPVNTGWTCSAIVPSASGAASVDGAQGITFTASSANQGCTRYVSMPEGNVGKLLEYSMYVKSTGGDVEVCSINDSIVSNCKTYTIGQSTDVVKVIVTDRPKNANTNANGILFRTKTATSTTFLGDLAYIGLPKSDEAIVAKFDNTTMWVDLGPTVWTASTTAPTKGTTSRDKVWGRRNGPNLDLRIEYSQSATGGANGSGVFYFNLPSTFMGSPININYNELSSISPPTSAASTVEVGNSNLGFVRLNYASSAGAGVGSFAAITGNRLAIPLTLTNNSVKTSDSFWMGSGFSLFSTAFNFVAYASIPIAEWSSQTNAAIVACQEGELKCRDTFTASVTAAGVVTYPTGQVPWISGNACSLSGSLYTCNYISGLTLVNPMDCSVRINSNTAANVNNKPTSSNTQVIYETYAPSNSSVIAQPVNLTCSKQGVDFKSGTERVVIHAGITGQTIDMRGPNCPLGTLPENGALVSATEYSSLFNVIGYTYGGSAGFFRLPDSRGKANMGSISIPNATGTGTPVTNNATFTGHQFNRTGIRVRVVSGTLTGLATNTDYYTIYIDNNTLAFAATYANAIAGTKIAISGTNSVVIRQSVAASNTVAGNEIEDTFQGHVHDYYGAQSGTGNTSGAGTSAFRAFTTHGIQENATNGSVRFGDVTAPYHLVTTKCIKY